MSWKLDYFPNDFWQIASSTPFKFSLSISSCERFNFESIIFRWITLIWERFPPLVLIDMPRTSLSRASLIPILIAARQLQRANAFHIHSTHAAPSPKVIWSSFKFRICRRVLGGENFPKRRLVMNTWFGRDICKEHKRLNLSLIWRHIKEKSKEGASLLCEEFLRIHFKRWEHLTVKW